VARFIYCVLIYAYGVRYVLLSSVCLLSATHSERDNLGKKNLVRFLGQLRRAPPAANFLGCMSANNLVYHSVCLSISNRSLRCTDVAEALAGSGIAAKVSSNISSTVDGQCESGCTITIHRISKRSLQQDVWVPLKKKEELSCGHVVVPGTFSGCILDLFQPSLCS